MKRILCDQGSRCIFLQFVRLAGNHCRAQFECCGIFVNWLTGKCIPNGDLNPLAIVIGTNCIFCHFLENFSGDCHFVVKGCVTIDASRCSLLH